MLTLRYSVRILRKNGALGEYPSRKGVRTACEACMAAGGNETKTGVFQFCKSVKMQKAAELAYLCGFAGLERSL